jgi:ABC-2 type transport system permease protein
VTRPLQVFGTLVRAYISVVLEHPAAAFLYILTSVFPLVMLAGWLALLRGGATIRGWQSSGFVTYYVAAMVVNQLSRTWVSDTWEEAIRSGTLSAQFLQPVNPVSHYLADHMAHKVVDSAVIAPLLIVAISISQDLRFTTDPLMLILGVLATILGSAMNFLMALCCAMVAFWSEQTGQLYQVWVGIGAFLSGWIIPISLLPKVMQDIARFLPFLYTLGFPAQVLSGQVRGTAAPGAFLIGASWTVAFYSIYRLLRRHGMRHFQAVGG